MQNSNIKLCEARLDTCTVAAGNGLARLANDEELSYARGYTARIGGW